VIYVLDASALVSYLMNESGSDIVSDLLEKAVDGEDTIYMNIVKLIEVHYGNIRSLGSEKAAVILKDIFSAPIQIVSDISEAVFQQSARLKASYKCSIADAIGLATAIELSGHFVTSDHHELEPVAENEPIPFVWLPPHPKNK
jgi:predicted nucleic acid-binding protein